MRTVTVATQVLTSESRRRNESEALMWLDVKDSCARVTSEETSAGQGWRMLYGNTRVQPNARVRVKAKVTIHYLQAIVQDLLLADVRARFKGYINNRWQAKGVL